MISNPIIHNLLRISLREEPRRNSSCFKIVVNVILMKSLIIFPLTFSIEELLTFSFRIDLVLRRNLCNLIFQFLRRVCKEHLGVPNSHESFIFHESYITIIPWVRTNRAESIQGFLIRVTLDCVQFLPSLVPCSIQSNVIFYCIQQCATFCFQWDLFNSSPSQRRRINIFPSFQCPLIVPNLLWNQHVPSIIQHITLLCVRDDLIDPRETNCIIWIGNEFISCRSKIFRELINPCPS
ncbi:hypothetical protein D3C75_557480 [compost metagenome]